MDESRCVRRCSCGGGLTRRGFLGVASAGVAALSLRSACLGAEGDAPARKDEAAGPGAKCVPNVRACFVRRKGDYGMRWPGAVYDGAAALKKYTEEVGAAAKELKLKLDLRPEPLYSQAEGDAWIAEAVEAKPDGLLVVVLDRQEHAWPTANKAIDTKLPTVVFSPVGTSFTTNTAAPSRKPGCFIASTDDFRQVKWGLKMLHAGAKMRSTRCLVIAGGAEREGEMERLGIKLRYVPAKTFLDEYEKTPETDEIRALAEDYMKRARRQVGATKQDVLNGVRSYVVARTLRARAEADAITMDCLGALGRSKVSLPCIAWSRMNDDGIPAACEADLGAVATHIVVQYLFDRPGFQQDPVAETARGAVIGAHCSCPTRLNGFGQPPEPFDIVHHHGLRDAVPRTLWKIGQRITCLDVELAPKGGKPRMLISVGEVIENVSVPPAGGCVVSVMAKFDGGADVLSFPGFHQLFFYGDYKAQLIHFCRLFNIEAVVV
ncbi:MAG: hypothetical protein FJ291_11385 [Planctomycetes bacterium]|nr:hypothetical protein [Planctomycetota bacterium]